MKKYEYLVLDEYFETLEDLSKRVNELGKEGWLLLHPRDGLTYFVREIDETLKIEISNLNTDSIRLIIRDEIYKALTSV